MSKVMLVEDDDSLREIYSIRLTAEGYTIVSAKDGEEALAVAVRERPDLIVSDVMMPKISGFDMLDILRSTPETQNIKVIMMTALSSEDQRVRGESLGADRYLVKSQVGIEDVVNVVHDVLGDRAADGTINPSTPANDTAMPVAAGAVLEVPGGVPMAGAPAPMQAGVAPVAPVAPVIPAPAGSVASVPGAPEMPAPNVTPNAATSVGADSGAGLGSGGVMPPMPPSVPPMPPEVPPVAPLSPMA